MEPITHQNHTNFAQGTHQGLHCLLQPRMPVKGVRLESEEEEKDPSL